MLKFPSLNKNLIHLRFLDRSYPGIANYFDRAIALSKFEINWILRCRVCIQQQKWNDFIFSLKEFQEPLIALIKHRIYNTSLRCKSKAS